MVPYAGAIFIFTIALAANLRPALPFNILHSLPKSHPFHHRSNTRLHSSPDDSPDPPKRRRKKNKYASFSKAPADGEADPYEALVASCTEASSRLASPSLSPPSAAAANKTNATFPDNKDIDPYDPSTYGWIPLGYISSAHGVHGFVKVRSDTDFGSERLCAPGYRGVRRPGRRTPRERMLLEGRKAGDGGLYIVRFEGCGGRVEAEKMKGCEVFLRVEVDDVELLSGDDLDKSEWKVSQLVGLEVREGGQRVGVVASVVLASDVHPQGLGSDMLEVALVKEEAEMEVRTALMPLVKEIVPIVDVEGGFVEVTPPPGLLDLAVVKEEKVRIRGLLAPSQEDNS